MKDSLIFYIEKGDNSYVIRLDPDRYNEVYKDGKRYYHDKLSNSIIPEDVFKIMLDELTTQPIRNVKVTLKELYATILQVRERVSRSLKNLEFDSAIMPSDEFLKRYLNDRMRMVVLYVDIVGSTKLSERLDTTRLAVLIKVFAQEMSYLISAYNGYILKYAGDCVISFFPILSDNIDKVSRDAVNCARAMINIVRYAINPVLLNNGYPELQVKIGIDLGENQIISIGKSLDIIGYTMSIAAKIAELASAWSIIIGKWVYDALDQDMKQLFKQAKISKSVWNYRDSREGEYYSLYTFQKRIVAKHI